jgi:hypothetical protein
LIDLVLSADVALPQRTETLPDDQRDGVFTDVDLITAMRVRSGNDEHPLLAGLMTFILGSAAGCAVHIHQVNISRSHCLLERLQNRIRVTDLESKNGIAFQGRKHNQIHLCPGDKFAIGETELYALNDEMRQQHAVLTEIIGPERLAIVDDALMEAVHGRHLFVKAEPGSDQERLGRALHRVSLRRRHHFVIARAGAAEPPSRAHIKRARHGTLLLRLDAGSPRLDPDFVEALLQPEAHIRLIVCARSLKDVIDALTEELVGRAYRIEVLPLRERAGEITSLLERRFIDRGGKLQFADLTDENQQALLSHGWPENLEEVREAADRFLELARIGDASERQAATDINMPRTNFKRWLEELGLSWPLFRSMNHTSTK